MFVLKHNADQKAESTYNRLSPKNCRNKIKAQNTVHRIGEANLLRFSVILSVELEGRTTFGTSAFCPVCVIDWFGPVCL